MNANLDVAIRDVKELTPLAQTACKLFLEECEKNGVAIFITETYRSQERQNYLYSKGRTIGGAIVTQVKKSRHTSRMAWDIGCKGLKLYDSDVLASAGKIAMALGITWGGAWKGFVDSPHFEIDENWKSSKVENKDKKTTKIKINGKYYELDIIFKDETNYIKVRDLSKAGFKISSEGAVAVIESPK